MPNNLCIASREYAWIPYMMLRKEAFIRLCGMYWNPLQWEYMLFFYQPLDVVGLMDQCNSKIDLVKYMWGQWPIFHGPLVLSFSIVIDLNYFYTLRNGAGRGGIRAPPSTCSSLLLFLIAATTESTLLKSCRAALLVWYLQYLQFI